MLSHSQHLPVTSSTTLQENPMAKYASASGTAFQPQQVMYQTEQVLPGPTTTTTSSSSKQYYYEGPAQATTTTTHYQGSTGGFLPSTTTSMPPMQIISGSSVPTTTTTVLSSAPVTATSSTHTLPLTTTSFGVPSPVGYGSGGQTGMPTVLGGSNTYGPGNVVYYEPGMSLPINTMTTQYYQPPAMVPPATQFYTTSGPVVRTPDISNPVTSTIHGQMDVNKHGISHTTVTYDEPAQPLYDQPHRIVGDKPYYSSGLYAQPLPVATVDTKKSCGRQKKIMGLQQPKQPAMARAAPQKRKTCGCC